jgi:rhodanese-related sulfurtransferase
MSFQSISPEKLQELMQKNEAMLIDVREPAEYEAENINGSKNIPLSQVNFSQIPADNKKIVIHCNKGGRGGSACEKLIGENPNAELYNLEGGIRAWIEAGLPVNKSASKFIPLDRQVMIAIGVLLIFFNILASAISPNLFYFTGLIGAGLIFAGFSGICALAMLIAKMPWNQKVAEKNVCMIKK